MVWLPVPCWRKRRLEGLPPALAGDLAFRLFCTPQVSQWRHPEHPKLVARARYHLRGAQARRIETPVGGVQIHIIDPVPSGVLGTVLIVHGWTSEASFMTALAEPVRRVGFRVVLMDMPAHGASEGRATNLIDCARATLAVGQAIGPLAGIVAHSFGGMVSLLAMEGGAPLAARLAVPQIALVASPNRLAQITRLFAEHWGLSSAGLRAFEKRLERVGHRPLGRFSSVALLAECPSARALVVHAPDDEAVPFTAAEEIAAALPQAELKVFQGLGHRNILFAPQVARAVVAFLKAGVETGQHTANPSTGN